MNRGFAALTLLSMPVLAQAPPSLPVKAPTELEEAVRQRADEFYQLQMDGKFRPAEKYVCESSQDTYYSAEKRKWLSKEFVKVDFGPDFKSAIVSMRLGMEAVMPPAGRVTLKSVVRSDWKLEGGSWCYDLPKEQFGPRDTPFGKMSSKPDDSSKAVDAPAVAKAQGGAVMRAVSVSKRELRVKGHEASTDHLELTNGLPGEVELQMTAPDMQGLDVTVSPTKLRSKEKATLTVHYKPSTTTAKATSEVVVRVVPTGQAIRLKLYFDVPAEVLKQVPKDSGTVRKD